MVPRVVSAARAGEWRIDGERSRLAFTLRHIVVHEIRGGFGRWGGTVELDDGDPDRSSVRVWVDLRSVDTGEPERDAHVRSPEFFDVERFPEARFASSEIRRQDGRHATIRGQLDLHGVTRDVELDVTARETWRDARGADRMVHVVEGRLDRQQFGLRWNQDLDAGGVVLGDQIALTAHVESVREPSPPSKRR